MTSTRRQLRAQAAAPALALEQDVPDCLRAGRCVEVWDLAGHSPITAWRRHARARQRWLDLREVGLWEHARMPAVLRCGGPWSYRELARGPALLADQLHRMGLPPDWTPTPAPAAWLTTATPNPRGTS